MRLDTFGYQVHIASYVISRLEDICNFLVSRYTSVSQVHIAPQFLDRLEDTCNRMGLTNIFDLMFWVD